MMYGLRRLALVVSLLAVPTAVLAQTNAPPPQQPPGQIPDQIPTQVTPAREPVTPHVHPIQPSVSVGLLYDSNLFWQTAGNASDLVLRVSPGVSSTLTRSKVTVQGSYNLAAERYQDHPALTTVAADQSAVFHLTGKPGPRTTISGGAGFFSTFNPSEFNSSTGLTAGRIRVRREQAGMSFTQMVTSRTRLEGGYEFAHDTSKTTDFRATAQTGAFQLAHDTGPLTELSLKLAGQHYGFGTFRQSISAETLTLGIIRRFGTGAHVGFAAGPQWTQGRLRAQIDVSIGRAVNFTDVSVSYGRGQTTAIGRNGVIEADHVEVNLVRAPPTSTRLSLSGGLYWNRQSGQTARVTHLSVEVDQPVTNVLAIVVGYTFNLQHGLLGEPALANQQLRRTTAIVQLAVTPWRVQ